MSFEEFFQEMHGVPPFSWQSRLAEFVLSESRYPEVVDLPTGSGKTALMDIAFFAFINNPEKMPRRIMFCADRKIIVDQVYDRAKSIQDKIENSTTASAELLRKRLNEICGGHKNSLLGVTPLRGGIPIDNEWTRHPNMPWVIATTVDQLGSRLLFRGYGVTDRMKPIHAALAGNDCLVILDEAHISKPFAETLRNVLEQYHSNLLPDRKFHIVEMTATPALKYDTKFSIVEEDMLDDQLRKRIEIPKQIYLHATPSSQKPAEGMASATKKILSSIPEEAKSIGIVVNRVATARHVHETLKENGEISYLVTGRMRPLDRQKTIDYIENLVSPEYRERDCDNVRAFVVCTQTIEVGADYDFDAMITECSPIDSLKQRIGRLDRRGDYFSSYKTPALCWVVGITKDIKSKKPDFIYGDAAKETWHYLLSKQTSDNVLATGNSTITFLDDAGKDCLSPKLESPLLLESYMNAWSQTSDTKNIISPDVSPFLHGKESISSCDVNIIWREDIRDEALKHVPPRPTEYMTLPIYAVKSWLASSSEVAISDAAFIVDEYSVEEQNIADTMSVLKWMPDKRTTQQISSIEDIEVGDIIVAHTSRGGIQDSNWCPESSDTVSDIGDISQHVYAQKRTLRLDPKLYDWVWHADLESPDFCLEEYTEDIMRYIQEKDINTRGESDIAKKLAKGYSCHIIGKEDEHRYIVLSATKKIDESVFDGTDETMSQTGSGAELKPHMEGVGKIAKEFSEQLKFSKEIAEDMQLAGELHDLGKTDIRFQKMLTGNDPVMLEYLHAENRILAKSPPKTPRTRKHGYPKGMRHEAASIAMMQSSTEIEKQANDIDLVKHLIASHHGHGRPWIFIPEDNSPQTMAYEWQGIRLEADSDIQKTEIAVEQAERFGKLSKKYGIYGLVWMEAIFRLADHKRSYLEGVGHV